MVVTNFQGLAGGTLPNSITQIDFGFIPDSAPPCPVNNFTDTGMINSWYYGNGLFFFKTPSISCGSPPGIPGARDDGVYQVTFIANNGETHSVSPATYRLAKYRNLTSAVLVAPADTAALTNNIPTFTWTAPVNNTDGVSLVNRVIVERVDNGQRVFNIWLGTGTSTTVPPGILEEGVEYRWHIRSYDNANYADADNIARSYYWTFTADGPAPIPTLGEWGFIVLGLILAFISIRMVRRPDPLV